jgi:hypothetical protein
MPGTWGDHPALPPLLDQAFTARQQGSDPRTVFQILASDPADELASVLARLGRALQAANPQ